MQWLARTICDIAPPLILHSMEKLQLENIVIFQDVVLVPQKTNRKSFLL
jgi:hypothetical protein